MAAKNEEDLVELLEYRLQVFEHKLSNVILLNEELLKRNEELKNELSEKSQINNTLLGKLRAQLDWSLNKTTCHGIRNLFIHSHLALKIVWSFAIVFVIGCGLFYIVANLQDYWSYPVITNINLIPVQPMIFPAVTMCSMNYDNFKYNLDEILISCRFNLKTCTMSDFRVINDRELGYCFRFNSIPINGSFLASSRVGKTYGLSVELFAGLPIETQEKNNGFQVYIHNNTVKPTDRHAIEVIPGLSTNLVVERKWDRKLPPPYNQCLPTNEPPENVKSVLYAHIMRGRYTYSQQYCFDLCNDLEVLEQCDCTQGFRLAGRKDCAQVAFEHFLLGNSTSETCSMRLNRVFYEGPHKKCIPLCPAKCEEFIYSTTTSFSEYPSENYYNVLKEHKVIQERFPNNSVTYEKVKKTVLSIHIYYRDLSYTDISQIPKSTMADLLASLGGNLGLFMGISVCTLVEFCEWNACSLSLILQACFGRVLKKRFRFRKNYLDLGQRLKFNRYSK